MMAYQMAARNGYGMRGSVGCYSIVHCWNIYIYIYIYIETTEQMFLFLNVFTLFQRRDF